MNPTFFADKNLLQVPLNRAAYSDRTAWLMAECSRLAYENLKSEDSRLMAGGFQLIRVFKDQKVGTYAYLAKRDDMAVLAFRGTEQNFNDIIIDLKIRFYETNAGRMHRGFLEAYQVIAKEVQKEINQLKDVPIYVTGHSLGGALAVVATASLASDNIAACYTFGCPKVGDQEFSLRNNKIPIYRVINSNDIITYVPMFNIRYQGIGDIRYLSHNNELLYARDKVEETKMFLTYFIPTRLRQFFLRHRISEYCEKLKIIAEKRATYKKLEVGYSAPAFNVT